MALHIVSMAKSFGTDCPCGFTFTTPHGEDDAISIVQLHLKQVHGRLDATKQEARAAVKER